MECIIFLENTKFQECVWSAWILVCKWSPGSAFGVCTFQQKKMWECVGVRRSALKDSRVRLECALLTHCYALQTHFSTAREWLVAWTAPSHYLNQCWDIVNWILGNKLQWNFNHNSNIFIQENAFENVVCEMASILSQPQCVNTRDVTPLQMHWNSLSFWQ